MRSLPLGRLYELKIFFLYIYIYIMLFYFITFYLQFAILNIIYTFLNQVYAKFNDGQLCQIIKQVEFRRIHKFMLF